MRPAFPTVHPAHPCILKNPDADRNLPRLAGGEPRPVLQRLRHVLRADGLAAGEVSHGAGHLQDAMIAARRDLQLLHRRAEQRQRIVGTGRLALLLHVPRSQIGIAGEPLALSCRRRWSRVAAGSPHRPAVAGAAVRGLLALRVRGTPLSRCRPLRLYLGKAPLLPLAGRAHALAHGGRRLRVGEAGELVVVHPRHLDAEVNPVQQRTGEPALVASDLAGRAAARLA